MVTPIRIIGGENRPSMPIYEGLTVEYVSPSGEVWELTSPDGDRHRDVFIQPGGISGVSGKVTWDEAETVNQYGTRRTGKDNFRTTPLDVDLKLALRCAPGEMEALYRRFSQAFDFYSPGKLRFRSTLGGEFWAWVTDPTFPDWEDNLTRRRMMEFPLSLRVLEGHWYGALESYSGEVTFVAKGDRPLVPVCRFRWDGSATTFKIPDQLQVTLPAISEPRYISLERGMVGQVTRMDGSVDTALWSQLMGRVHGISLMPGTESTWQMGAGMTLEVSPRYLSPWR